MTQVVGDRSNVLRISDVSCFIFLVLASEVVFHFLVPLL
jgi:hypothetical protein